MELNLGIDYKSFKDLKKNESVIWNSKKVLNGHMLIMGKSGTGKTYNLRKILRQMLKQSEPGMLRAHIFDVHGDIEIPGASSVKFSSSTPYGFNPLWLNPDPDFGGVRRRIQSLLSALNRTSRKLGTKQESCLRNLLNDLFEANGFKESDVNSWKLNDGVQRKYPKKNPTLEDAHRFAKFKLKAMYIGASTDAVRLLEEVNKKSTSLYSKQRQALRTGNALQQESLQSDLDKLKQECIEKYAEYVNSIATGMEFEDLLRYDSRDVLKSVVERLENLNAIGIFKNQTPPFDTDSALWRYDIKALSMDEKKLFIEFRLEELFFQAVQRGVVDEIRDVIIIDEAHNFFSDDEDNILNTLAKEARKFGIALICASQAPTHFSDDFLANVGTKIILGLDQMYWDSSMRKLKIDMSIMENVVAQKVMAAMLNNKGETRSAFQLVLLTPDT